MRSGNGLSALCGIEYAAQAMALHSALSAQSNEKPRAGYLVGLRNVKCNILRLDTLLEDLLVEAEKLMGDDVRVIYQFALYAGQSNILSGRATVVLDAGKVTEFNSFSTEV